MKSPNNERDSNLRYRALRWLLAPLALLSLVILVEVYYSANSSTKSIQERMLVSQAIGIAQHAIKTGGDFAHLDLTRQMSGGLNFYRAQGPRNSYITGYSGPRRAARYRKTRLIFTPPATAAGRCAWWRCARRRL